MRYEDAVEAGYDGPSPFEERRHRNRVASNNALDCRDPDHDPRLCPWCSGEEEDEDE